MTCCAAMEVRDSIVAIAEQIRGVDDEDRHALEQIGLRFNLYSLVGGQQGNEDEHKFYLPHPSQPVPDAP